MEINTQLCQEVLARLHASEQERAQTIHYIQTGRIWRADTPERIEKRKVQILNNKSLASMLGETNRGILAGTTVVSAPQETQQAFEIVIEELDIQHCWFLTRGSEIRRTVGRIHVYQDGRRKAWGTGFLVAPNLLVTNQHVLESLAIAKESRVEFDYEETYSGEMLPSVFFDFDPEILFLSSPALGGLDYALVAVNAQSRSDNLGRSTKLNEFGFNHLVRQEGKIVKGEAINIIHHPEGQPRQVSLHENRLLAMQTRELEDVWMHYETDTLPGSSGAPLFSNQWQVVGIHHMAVEKRDQDGKVLAIGGEVWTPEMGQNRKWWYANEGLRISRFIADVEQKIREVNTPWVTDEQIVTETGLSLVEQMIKSDSNSSSKIPPMSRRFNPE
ncbi:serine protease [Gloeocapsa sp. PCC 73106]|uniref:trypsin-like serine peptidase n=1 Tax=Gloeocapsa sp. PCC 73106 TaxID=102232 RepID=UPI0002AC77BA|nr:serine protease [Gloeocapsa sp. PCC 73106]ELR96271.1 hypothetical protein GLO73106DRAFT_00000600 [Gloeocapsa sp. PCC 73106]